MCFAHITAVILVFSGNLFLADLWTSEVLPLYSQEMANNLKTNLDYIFHKMNIYLIKQVHMSFVYSQWLFMAECGFGYS